MLICTRAFGYIVYRRGSCLFKFPICKVHQNRRITLITEQQLKLKPYFQVHCWNQNKHFATGVSVAAMAKSTPGVLKPGEDPLKLSDEDWKKRLDEEKYYVMREQGTERPFTGEHTYTTEDGMYHCGSCGAELFSSKSKFESHCGWPAFYEALGREGRDESNTNIIRREDNSHGMTRVEVLCKKCNGHLGHVFEDGPFPTGERFCINSVAMDFLPGKRKTKG